MNNELQIYRKRLIPEECILLKDDIIVEQNDDYILPARPGQRHAFFRRDRG